MNINHVLVLTTDLHIMTDFWTKVIGFHVGERPPFPFDGVWVYSNDKPLIHIAKISSTFENGAIAHVALEGADYIILINRLNESPYSYTEKIVPLSKERQVFIAGPNNLTVEMLFPLNEKNQFTEHKQLAYQANENLTFL